jgi:hypothetical protein
VAEKLFKKHLELGKCCNMHYEPLLNALKEFRAQENKDEETKQENKEETKEEISKEEQPKMENSEIVETSSEKKERNLKRKREEQPFLTNKKLDIEMETLRKMVEKTEKETKERLDYMERIFRAQIEAQQQQIKYLQQQIFELSDK